MASNDLWDKFRLAQRTKNGDAAVAFKNAIERLNKGKDKEAAWWEKQGDLAVNSSSTVEAKV